MAAYVTWLAVASGPLWHALFDGIASRQQALGISCLIAYLSVLVTSPIGGQRFSSAYPAGFSVIVQALLASICIWALEDNFQAVLLVLAAAQVAPLHQRRAALGALILANAALLAWLTRTMPVPKALQVGLAYVAFQFFAALVTHAAYSAFESERKVARTNRELVATRELVAEGARMQERLRLSRDLHDIAGHKLTALKLQLSVELRTRPPPTSVTLERCLGLADELLTDIRSTVSTLRQDDGVNLDAALLALNPGIPDIVVTFDIEPDAIVQDIDRAEALLRCAQEGITNALRHGGATAIRVALRKVNRDLTLTVEDDGTGLPPGTDLPGYGLRGLQERLQRFSGTVTLEGMSTRGCVLRAILPDETGAVC